MKFGVVSGYTIYFTTKCIAEEIVHAHASTKALTESNSIKIWFDENGNTAIANSSECGRVPTHIQKRICKYVCKHRMKIIENWCSVAKDGGYIVTFMPFDENGEIDKIKQKK